MNCIEIRYIILLLVPVIKMPLLAFFG